MSTFDSKNKHTPHPAQQMLIHIMLPTYPTIGCWQPRTCSASFTTEDSKHTTTHNFIPTEDSKHTTTNNLLSTEDSKHATTHNMLLTEDSKHATTHMLSTEDSKKTAYNFYLLKIENIQLPICYLLKIANTQLPIILSTEDSKYTTTHNLLSTEDSKHTTIHNMLSTEDSKHTTTIICYLLKIANIQLP